MGIGKAGLERRGKAKPRDRLVHLPGCQQGDPQVVGEDRVGSLQPHGIAELGQGLIQLAHLIVDQAQEVEGVGVFWLGREDATVDGRSPFEITPLLEGQSTAHRFGQGIHQRKHSTGRSRRHPPKNDLILTRS